MMDIAKHCLTAAGCSSGLGAHKIGQQVFAGLNQASCPTGLVARQAAGTCSSKKKLCGGRGGQTQLTFAH